MQFRNTLLVAAAAALVSAEDVYLVVKSDNSEINGNTLGFTHEGAGINYAFLGTAAQSEALTYDSSAKSLASTGSGFPFPLAFGFAGNYVQVSVEGSNSEFTFDGNTLDVNGTSTGFYACKNTNDPYNYSESSYELMYYPSSDAPSGCLSLTLEKAAGGASSSSAPSSSVAPPTETTMTTAAPTATDEPISSIYSGGAASNIAPISAFALVAGAFAALI